MCPLDRGGATILAVMGAVLSIGKVWVKREVYMASRGVVRNSLCACTMAGVCE